MTENFTNVSNDLKGWKRAKCYEIFANHRCLVVVRRPPRFFWMLILLYHHHIVLQQKCPEWWPTDWVVKICLYSIWWHLFLRSKWISSFKAHTHASIYLHANFSQSYFLFHKFCFCPYVLSHLFVYSLACKRRRRRERFSSSENDIRPSTEWYKVFLSFFSMKFIWESETQFIVNVRCEICIEKSGKHWNIQRTKKITMIINLFIFFCRFLFAYFFVVVVVARLCAFAMGIRQDIELQKRWNFSYLRCVSVCIVYR